MQGALACVSSRSAWSKAVPNGQQPNARLLVPGFAHSGRCARKLTAISLSCADEGVLIKNNKSLRFSV